MTGEASTVNSLLSFSKLRRAHPSCSQSVKADPELHHLEKHEVCRIRLSFGVRVCSKPACVEFVPRAFYNLSVGQVMIVSSRFEIKLNSVCGLSVRLNL